MSEVRKSQIDLYVSAQVKSKRLAQGWSQAILAVKLDVSDAFIGQTETLNNTSKYSLRHINKLAKIFNCAIYDFLPEKPLNDF